MDPKNEKDFFTVVKKNIAHEDIKGYMGFGKHAAVRFMSFLGVGSIFGFVGLSVWKMQGRGKTTCAAQFANCKKISGYEDHNFQKLTTVCTSQIKKYQKNSACVELDNYFGPGKIINKYNECMRQNKSKYDCAYKQLPNEYEYGENPYRAQMGLQQ